MATAAIEQEMEQDAALSTEWAQNNEPTLADKRHWTYHELMDVFYLCEWVVEAAEKRLKELQEKKKQAIKTVEWVKSLEPALDVEHLKRRAVRAIDTEIDEVTRTLETARDESTRSGEVWKRFMAEHEAKVFGCRTAEHKGVQP